MGIQFKDHDVESESDTPMAMVGEDVVMSEPKPNVMTTPMKTPINVPRVPSFASPLKGPTVRMPIHNSPPVKNVTRSSISQPMLPSKRFTYDEEMDAAELYPSLKVYGEMGAEER